MNNYQLTKKQLKHLAQLAQLDLSQLEMKKIRRQLEEILAYIRVLQRINLDKVEATSQVTGLENIFRLDKPAFSLMSKQALANARKKKDGYFLVKSTFKKWN